MKLHKSYRILNLEGAWLELKESEGQKEFIFSTTSERKYIDKHGKEIIIKPTKNKLYSATMPYSLETYRAFNLLPDEVINENGELFTKLFVNFKFTKDLFIDTDDKTTRINKKKLRKLIYNSTVKIDDIEYCFFKRGASKARTANVIFCKKEYYDKLYKPCLLGLKFKNGEKYDITSKEAYISLIMSGIIDIIKIKPEEILIIDDLMSPNFKAKQSVTKMTEEGTVFQDNNIENGGYFDVVNNMTDGQVLMDELIYTENEILNTATCALLRNDFFKGNACRVRLQEYWKENNITKVWDMYRGWIDASSIKLAITPSACKYLKFADQFKSEKECFLDWLKRIPSEFGVVKTDHIGNYGYSNRLSYQMLNSMNLSDNEVLNLMKDELNYYKLLKDNTLATSEDIKKMTKKDKAQNRKIRNEMSYFLDLVKNNESESMTNDMISDLLNRNLDFRLTKKFKDWKNEQLQDYIANLRLGKIRIKNSIYAIMISCPYEMLVATTKENNKIDSCIMDGWECYCPTFRNNAKLMAIRNPQINAGNINYMVNKYREEYKYFGYYEENKAKHNFVVFVNTYNIDLMNRAQGCDFDIDSIYLTDNKLLQSKAYESQKWNTPVNGIKGILDKRKLDNNSLAELDNYLSGSTMAIGKIVNKSAIFNAYMYHAINNRYSEDYIKSCYDASSTLSSFSQVAIDMAKKRVEGLSLTKQMNNLNKTYYKNEQGEGVQILEFANDKENRKIIKEDDYNSETHTIVRHFCSYKKGTGEIIKKYEVMEQKMIVPYFFTYIAKNNDYRIPTYMDCSMDYLEKILDNVETKSIQTDKVDISELLVMQKEMSGGAFAGNKIDKARKIIDNCQSIHNQNCYDKTDNEETMKQKNNLRKWSKKEAIKDLRELKLNEKTVHRILLRAFNIDKEYEGKVINKVDEYGELITYINYDEENNETIEVTITVRELKEMTILTLTLLYNAYPKLFIKCFKEKKFEEKELKRYW